MSWQGIIPDEREGRWRWDTAYDLLGIVFPADTRPDSSRRLIVIHDAGHAVMSIDSGETRRYRPQRPDRNVLVYLDGVEYRCRATIVGPKEGVTEGAGKLIRRQTTLRFLLATPPDSAQTRDLIEVGGRTLHVMTCLELGARF